jgi:hypothetical protein
MRVSRFFRFGLAALVMAAGSAVIPAGPANAVTVAQTCAGTEVTTFDPPLTLTPQPVTITVNGVYPTCTDPAAFNGSYSETFTLTASCLTLFDAGTATRTIVWGTPSAEPTTFDYNVVTNAVGGQVITTNSGVLTGGRYTPGSVQQVITLVTPNILQCLGSGVTGVTGPTVLTILQP